MSMMRKKWKYSITASALELDEDAAMELKEGRQDDESSNNSDEEEKKAEVQSNESILKNTTLAILDVYTLSRISTSLLL